MIKVCIHSSQHLMWIKTSSKFYMNFEQYLFLSLDNFDELFLTPLQMLTTLYITVMQGSTFLTKLLMKVLAVERFVNFVNDNKDCKPF